ncbi:DEAD/DEAH box helicase [Pseudosulfitobacter pseudonitzschiae]|uniref:DEAD/DEAH box helicase n=1 Tax=Pseudosulfitobacter pseudonitzschiae TaxID=1402135 RepID=UPI001AF50780|nr:DEAD/DEAH box helicase [Pseudosulfitobacter pseudonitzschiae]MBM1814632.1 DEAD/DEAH box helicase [Pseudosulfitobacter pseudonitzschiae]MBM1831626.1 DEAD/DEAH box helicase [Pseudosulfitobacter pseudonitzschiae]MBM1836491.1 DEAD/DEAH box helicase [Pseudosulfitobacter pseudonitzschiae]MBM1841338.1 DEAD/DEAH box helicase [Pseudosulfitobacter pseudonitzschiae]MBM1846205.1 DEAD/DEAH box helicase [Pseudosulfitobacter pseudonitzschiae]
MSDFDMMDLPSELVKKLADMGLKDPTPIQRQAIPHALNGRDVMGLAQTGTGKTAAFGVPLVAQMLQMTGRPNPRTVRGLVLAPTRELANQIMENLKGFCAGTPLKAQMVVGGMSINPQIKRLERGVDLLVATPGRLLDLMDRRAVDLRETTFLVLDEADQMLDMGFIHDLRKIAAVLPKERQTMLFSATMPKLMNEIANSYLNSPIRIEVNPPGKAADKVTQEVHFIAKAEKSKFLMELLDKHRDERALVFGRTKHGMEKLSRMLDKAGFAAGAIHGNKSQGQRDRAIAAFKSGEIKVLVATDVAARGLDIPDVKHVYNYELPNVPDSYVHRIGRTARAGKDGAAVAFCAPDEIDQLRDIQKTMGVKIPIATGRAWESVDLPAKGGKPGGKPGGGRRRGGGGGRPGGGAPGGGAPSGGGPRRRRRGGGGGKPGGSAAA